MCDVPCRVLSCHLTIIKPFLSSSSSSLFDCFELLLKVVNSILFLIYQNFEKETIEVLFVAE
jgi:hypothetical protein